MWTPDHFAPESDDWLLRLVDENPFGLLVSAGAGAPTATHVPMLVRPDDREAAAPDLVGSRVVGHLARANRHWRSLTDGEDVLLVFQGPHGYVSPTLYPDLPAAPTWNYTAVHLTGPIRLLHDPAEMMRIVDHTIDTVESPRADPWDREPSRGYFDRIIGGIVGFEIEVSRSQSSFKLSQDQWDARRAAVTHDALAGADPSRRGLGRWMQRSTRPGPLPPASARRRSGDAER